MATLSKTSTTPAGTIQPFGGTVAPAGYFLCDGSTVSRTTYAKLFSSVGTAFGSGNGTSTFHLPDFRGKFLRGVSSGTANDPDRLVRTAMNAGGNTGDSVGSIQGDELKRHRHLSGVTQDNTGGSSYAAITTANNDNTGEYLTSYEGGNESRPVNAYVNFIIKY